MFTKRLFFFLCTLFMAFALNATAMAAVPSWTFHYGNAQTKPKKTKPKKTKRRRYKSSKKTSAQAMPAPSD